MRTCLRRSSSLAGAVFSIQLPIPTGLGGEVVRWWWGGEVVNASISVFHHLTTLPPHNIATSFPDRPPTSPYRRRREGYSGWSFARGRGRRNCPPATYPLR